MANLKKVRILERVGDPQKGVIIQPGTEVQLPEIWADRYISQGKAELVEEKPKAEMPAAESKPAKPKRK
jgi:hypothetical protein